MRTAAHNEQSRAPFTVQTRSANRIVLAGSQCRRLQGALETAGYRTVGVDDPTQMLSLSPPFSAMVIDWELLNTLRTDTIEQLYFQNDSVPIAVLLEDHTGIDEQLMETLREGTLEVLWSSDVLSGLFVRRIDRLVLSDRLDRHLRTLQRALSEKERLEQELSIREQTLTRERGINANILASITSGLIILDIGGTVILVNEHLPRLLPGLGDIMGASYAEALPAEVAGIAERVIPASETHACPSSTIGKCKVGDLYLEVSAYRMLDYRHRLSGTLLLLQDITEHEQMNHQLYRAEKLATVGTMLSGIAHELRNPLSIISARARRAMSKKSTDPAWIEKTFLSIDAQTERCASIVNNLLDFTRNTATTPRFHNAAEIIDETLTYVEYQNVFDNISVTRHYQPDAVVFGDRSRYVQVFLNLITNAADAMDGRGTLSINVERAGALSTLVKISDTGSGIAPEIQGQLFDPFFTTKEPGKGTGLGLAIVYKIVQESRGRIWFSSLPGRTTFTVMLPSVKERAHEGTHTTG